MNTQLFQGALVRLAPIEPEHDAEIESQWTHNAEYMRAMFAEPMRPLSPNQIKKKYEDAEKESHSNSFQFALRTLADDRLIGTVGLARIEWTNGIGGLTLGIGAADDRGKGYGGEALRLILAYAFGELNLYRVAVNTFEYNNRAIRFFERAGFQIEVRRREAIHRDGKRWDAVMLGLLRDEWIAQVKRQS